MEGAVGSFDAICPRGAFAAMVALLSSAEDEAEWEARVESAKFFPPKSSVCSCFPSPLALFGAPKQAEAVAAEDGLLEVSALRRMRRTVLVPLLAVLARWDFSGASWSANGKAREQPRDDEVTKVSLDEATWTAEAPSERAVLKTPVAEDRLHDLPAESSGSGEARLLPLRPHTGTSPGAAAPASSPSLGSSSATERSLENSFSPTPSAALPFSEPASASGWTGKSHEVGDAVTLHSASRLKMGAGQEAPPPKRNLSRCPFLADGFASNETWMFGDGARWAVPARNRAGVGALNSSSMDFVANGATEDETHAPELLSFPLPSKKWNEPFGALSLDARVAALGDRVPTENSFGGAAVHAS
mmetsp:Transcript_7348/g.17657  ORF Transcript_7348/g.17657 Transcript_7348/m.17657 type:complete len:359 (-) Transcript_7348:4382-5458(-)